MLAGSGTLWGPDLVIQQFAFPRVQGAVMANSMGKDAELGEGISREAGRELLQLLGSPGTTALCASVQSEKTHTCLVSEPTASERCWRSGAG